MTNRLLGCAAVAIFAMVSSAFAEPPKPKFQMGKDTTFITKPLDADGYLDFETALNERLRGKITPETNAVVLLWQAMGPKPFGKEMHADFYKWLGTKPPPEKGEYFQDTDDTDIAEWLKRNEKPLALVVQATQRKEYFNPLVSRTPKGERGSLLGALLHGVQKSRKFADALVKRAVIRTDAGQFDEAWQDLIAVHRLARLTSRGGCTLELLAGIAIDATATKADLVFLETSKPNAKQVLQYLKELQELPPMSSAADKIDKSERFSFLDAMQAIRRNGLGSIDQIGKDKENEDVEKPDEDTDKALASFDWPIIFGIGNQNYDNLEKALRLPTYDERRKATLLVEANVQKLRNKLNGGFGFANRQEMSERIGILGIGLLMPAASKINRAAGQSEQSHQNLQLAFALAAYRADNGKYPATLDSLAPKYLAKIPGDLFNDKPLIYKPNATGYVLYSVGENGKDDDGANDDLTVRMPNP